jgi:ADP-heptose:LPS heptosyltransferase
MTRRVLVVRLDSMGDVLICGPAVRAVAAQASVTMLVGPQGAAAAHLLPGVSEVLVWNCPWIVADPPPVGRQELADLAGRIAAGKFDEAIVLTSFHQSALPTALLLRLAGLRQISACSTDYPGSLLDLRIAEPAELPEPIRMGRIAAAAGYPPPVEDDGLLGVRLPANLELPALPDRYVVVHAGAAAPSRTCSESTWAGIVECLAAAGWQLVLTGSGAELRTAAMLTGIAPLQTLNLAGQLEVPQLAGVLSRAAAVVVGNTGPAHLAAAVRVPIVSLFAPVVSAAHWAPFTDRLALLGDQQAPCHGSRARVCPVAGHPCLDLITGADVLSALAELDVPAPLPQTEAVG